MIGNKFFLNLQNLYRTLPTNIFKNYIIGRYNKYFFANIMLNIYISNFANFITK